MYVQSNKDHLSNVVGLEHLGASVVISAVQDYRRIAAKIRKHPEKPNTMYWKQMKELETFFRSGWCDTLCQSLDTDKVMTRMIAEVRQWCRNSSGKSKA